MITQIDHYSPHSQSVDGRVCLVNRILIHVHIKQQSETLTLHSTPLANASFLYEAITHIEWHFSTI